MIDPCGTIATIKPIDVEPRTELHDGRGALRHPLLRLVVVDQRALIANNLATPRNVADREDPTSGNARSLRHQRIGGLKLGACVPQATRPARCQVLNLRERRTGSRGPAAVRPSPAGWRGRALNSSFP